MIIEGFSGTDIEVKTGVSRSVQSYIKKRTYIRGFRSKQDSRILEYYIQDRERSNRSKEISLKTEQHLINNVQLNRVDREKLSKVLTYECGIN